MPTVSTGLPDLPGSRLIRAYGRFLYGMTKATAGPALRRLYNVRVQGADRIPSQGAAIITPNHLSLIDPFFIALVAPRHVTFIGKAEYFDDWRSRIFMELGGVIPVRREDSIKAQGSLHAGEKVLGTGRLLGIFPEGTRSPDGRLYKGKSGAARMALEIGCPVIPTGLIGTRHVMPKDAKVPGLGPRITVKFGKPMFVPAEAREDARLLRPFTDRLMQEIAGLSAQEYRDRYAYTKRIGRPEPVVPFA
jgi:1-acyl-sn-glycerol-3-phosphate acyltransferase